MIHHDFRETLTMLAALALLAVTVVLSGCATTAPSLYPDELPSIEPPAADHFDDEPGDTAVPIDVAPGTTVDVGGVLMPTGLSIMRSDLELRIVPWLDDALGDERRYRLQDRSTGQDRYEVEWKRANAAEQREDALRVAISVTAVVMFLLGVAMDDAESRLNEAIP